MVPGRTGALVTVHGIQGRRRVMSDLAFGLTYVVNSATQVSEALQVINGDVRLKVEADTVEYLKVCLNTANDIEHAIFQNGKQWGAYTQLKHLPFELRKAAIQWALDPANLDKVVDPSLILNVFNLIKGYNTFDQSFFESQHILVNSMLEMSDMKRALKEPLTDFITCVCKYYLSILRSASVTEYMPSDKPVKLPVMIDSLFRLLDFMTLSSLLRKSKAIGTDTLFNVENASGYLLILSNKYGLGNKVAQETMESGE